MADVTTSDIREAVRERYAAAARQATEGGGCCGPESEASCCGPADIASEPFGAALYGDEAPAPPTRRWRRRWAAASRPPSPTSSRARRSSTSAPAPAPTCSSAPGGSRPAAARSGST